MGMVLVVAGAAAFIVFLAWVVDNPSDRCMGKRRRGAAHGHTSAKRLGAKSGSHPER